MYVIGSKKQRKKASLELENNPLKCGDIETKEKQVDKWLGQVLSSAGQTDSVAKTVETREGKIRAACLEIAQIVDYWRARVVGRMETAMVLWEACCVPSLLHGACTWVEMSSETERRLNTLQQWFLRLILQVGPGAPLPLLGWETGFLDMGLRVWREKVMLVLHIRNLGQETLARKIYEQQKAEGWPGLAVETKRICEEFNIQDCNETFLTKKPIQNWSFWPAKRKMKRDCEPRLKGKSNVRKS